MTQPPAISVIVVSHQRPAALRRCLMALQQQDHPALELLIVVEPDTGTQVQQAMRAAGWAGTVIDNPGGNISAARNLGLQAARGEVVAFIDDDAVAEPTWARRLAAPFADPAVVAATGYTRGRNGISLQWTACEVDATGADHPLPLMAETVALPGDGARAVKPVGTNCAFRRADLLAVGGFDPAYRFFLDDADIGLRIAARGKTAIVPGAQVHHAFAPSARRRADRVPTDLHEIGASAQVFLRRHAPPEAWPPALDRLRQEQTARMARHRRARRITAAEEARVLATLEAGLEDGAHRPLAPMAPLADPAEANAFQALPGTGPRAGRVLAGRFWQARRLRQRAAACAARGEIVTLFLFAPTIRRHRHHYDGKGFWVQTGGLFGASERSQPLFRWWRFAQRVVAETARVADFRPVSREIPPR